MDYREPFTCCNDVFMFLSHHAQTLLMLRTKTMGSGTTLMTAACPLPVKIK